MSLKNLFKAKAKNVTDSRTYKIITAIDHDPYWDEGINYYRWNYKRHKKHLLFMYQVRMYKTWKHNRKTQYK